MTTAGDAERLVAGVHAFAADLQTQGIHVGLGTPPRCVTCMQAWPCTGANSQLGTEPVTATTSPAT